MSALELIDDGQIAAGVVVRGIDPKSSGERAPGVREPTLLAEDQTDVYPIGNIPRVELGGGLVVSKGGAGLVELLVGLRKFAMSPGRPGIETERLLIVAETAGDVAAD